MRTRGRPGRPIVIPPSCPPGGMAASTRSMALASSSSATTRLMGSGRGSEPGAGSSAEGAEIVAETGLEKAACSEVRPASMESAVPSSRDEVEDGGWFRRIAIQAATIVAAAVIRAAMIVSDILSPRRPPRHGPLRQWYPEWPIPSFRDAGCQGGRHRERDA